MTTLYPGGAALRPISRTASRNIDALRVFLVLEVLLGHLALIALPPFANLDLHRWPDRCVALYRMMTRFGPQAAYMFVFLSGYFIAPHLIDAALGGTRIDPRAYLRRRLGRIYPTLVAAVVLTLVFDLVGAGLLGQAAIYRTTFNYDAVAALEPRSAVGNLLSLQPTFVAAFGSNGPLWTLGYIFQFYVAGLLLALGVRNAPRASAPAAIGVAIAAALLRPEWLLLFAAWLGAGFVRAVRVERRPAFACALGGAVLFVLANRFDALSSIVLTTLASALLVTGLRMPVANPDCTTPRWLAWVSGLSFAIYAFHMPTAMLLYAASQSRFEVDRWPFWCGYVLAVLAIVTLLAWGWDSALRRVQGERGR